MAAEEYLGAGAEVSASAEGVYSAAGLIVKVKEPRPEEYRFLRPGLSIFTFFHLAADPSLALELIRKNVTALAYETLELEDRSLPILAPMSEVAGRLSVQAGAYHLLRSHGGRGVLLGGVPGVEAGSVGILGGGVGGGTGPQSAQGTGP